MHRFEEKQTKKNYKNLSESYSKAKYRETRFTESTNYKKEYLIIVVYESIYESINGNNSRND